jgi:hypothetical protein
VVEKAVDTFQTELKIIKEGNYDPRHFFNCDETGLFWNKVHKSANQSSGFKAWKDRLTPVQCGNAAGHTIKHGFVYRAKNPRALKKNKNLLPVCWQHNLRSCAMVVLLTKLFH